MNQWLKSGAETSADSGFSTCHVFPAALFTSASLPAPCTDRCHKNQLTTEAHLMYVLTSPTERLNTTVDRLFKMTKPLCVFK